MKAAVSWQLGQALVSVIQLSQRPRSILRRVYARFCAPPTDFPGSGSPASPPRPWLLPFPPPAQSTGSQPSAADRRNPSGAAWGQSPFPFFSLTRVASPGRSDGDRRRERCPRGVLGFRGSPAPSGLWSARGTPERRGPLAGLRGPPGAPG